MFGASAVIMFKSPTIVKFPGDTKRRNDRATHPPYTTRFVAVCVYVITHTHSNPGRGPSLSFVRRFLPVGPSLSSSSSLSLLYYRGPVSHYVISFDENRTTHAVHTLYVDGYLDRFAGWRRAARRGAVVLLLFYRIIFAPDNSVGCTVSPNT